MGITISNSQCLWLRFSLRSTPQHLWVMGAYIVWVQIVCIRNDNLAKKNVSREGLIRETLAKTSCLHLVLTFRIPVISKTYASLHEKFTRKLPAKTALVFN